ncbi:MAG: ABC transporter ATP-binding protein [Spirochaetaceae bacterium]|nr:ABC transporter ATP-binding protein [Spirochaetaceae bacterium]
MSSAAEPATGPAGTGPRPRGAATRGAGVHGAGVRCENLVRIFKTDEVEVVALQGLDLEIEAGEVMAIIGSSGSGKSTLLNILGGLDRPSAGTVEVGGADLLKFSPQDLVRYRRETVGFVWQNSARNLVPYLTAAENVEVPMLLARRRGRRRQRALELLRQVGVDHRAGNRLMELSGGEQQRVAIAVALANEPPLLLADEPTGNVDSQTARHLLATFREVNRDLGVTVVIVTHDRAVAQAVSRVVAIRDGRTSSEFIRQRDAAGDPQVARPALHMEEADSHREYVVVDRVGRLQIPRDHLQALSISGRDRVRVDLEDDNIVIRRADDDAEHPPKK